MHHPVVCHAAKAGGEEASTYSATDPSHTNRFIPMQPASPDLVFDGLSRQRGGWKPVTVHFLTSSRRGAPDVIASTAGWVSLRSAVMA